MTASHPRHGFMLLACCLMMVACSKSASGPDQIDLSLISLDTSTALLSVAPVGLKRVETATFVLIDAKNSSQKEVSVTLEGDLLDNAGQKVGSLAKQSLRIPPGAVRTFGLLDSEHKVRENATQFSARVIGAMIENHPPPVIVTDGSNFDDQGRAVVAAYVENKTERSLKVVVFAVFSDKQGKLMSRPWEIVELDGGGKRGTRFVGPPGSENASMFVGDVEF